MDLLYFSQQSEDAELPQWDMACGAGQVWIVFRGTDSFQDLLRDFVLTPHPRGEGHTPIHRGILSGITEDQVLARQLRVHVTSETEAVTLCGHSLGGALAMALQHSGLLPGGPRYTVMMYGAPAVLHGEAHAGERPDVDIISVVNEDDVVPRALSSDFPVLTKLAEGVREGGLIDRQQLKDAV